MKSTAPPNRKTDEGRSGAGGGDDHSRGDRWSRQTRLPAIEMRPTSDGGTPDLRRPIIARHDDHGLRIRLAA